MWIIGIDPGLSGAVARLCLEDRDQVEIWDAPKGKNYPDPRECAELLRAVTYDGMGGNKFMIAIEATQGRPGQGVCASHNFGQGSGVWQGAAFALRPSEIRIVRPQVWMKDIWSRYGAHGDDTKVRTYQSMVNAHPVYASKLVTARGKLLDGRSDALAIATWLRDQLIPR